MTVVRDAQESKVGYDVGGMSVILSSQTYGSINPITNKHLRVALMHSANRGVRWVGDASANRMGYGAARNVAAQYAMKNADAAQGLVWIDSDIKPFAHSITKLLHVVKENGFDFLSGIYFQRTGVHNPVFYAWNTDKHCFQPAEQYPQNTLGMIDGCGFGFVYTSVKMLRDIALGEEFDEKTGWFPDRRDVGGFGEDLTFCYLAKKAGYQLWVDTGNVVEHEGEVQYIGEADFLAGQEQWIRENKEQKRTVWGANAEFE